MKKLKINEGFLKAFTIILLLVIATLGITLYKKQEEITRTSENSFNMAFYELVDYVQNVEAYLAKSLVSTTSERGAETLTHLWREANLAQSCLSMLPVESQELENTEKFLNQVSDYSYSLSRKNIYDEDLTQDDLKNLKQLHQYSVELENTLTQLSEDINSGRVNWKDLTKDENVNFAKQVSNISKDSFKNMEENFHEYSGLIYDGAFSEHITSKEKKGLTGDDITEEIAKQKVEEFIGKEKIKEINSLGFAENANIPSYNFSLKTEECDNINVSISKKGGHIIYTNGNREVNSEIISYEDAVKNGSKYLDEKGIQMWIRHVVVPHITLNKEYLYELGLFIGKLKMVKALDILPYHDMAKPKYEKLGMDYPLKDIEPATKEMAVAARKIVLQGFKESRIKLLQENK